MTYIYQSGKPHALSCGCGACNGLGAPSGNVVHVPGGILIRGDQPFRPSSHRWDPIVGAVSAVETDNGGYNTVNMYDHGILSWGILQWSVHAGSLQRLLAFLKARLGAPVFGLFFPGLDVKPVKGRPEPDLVVNGKVCRTAVPSELVQGLKPSQEFWAQILYRAGQNPTVQALQNEWAFQQLDNLLQENPHSKPSVRAAYGKATFATVGDYLGRTVKGLALFFSMWVNNRSWVFRKLADAVHALARRFKKTHHPSTWPAGWPGKLADQFEHVLRVSQVADWGDAKAAPRKSRTQKTLDALFVHAGGVHGLGSFPDMYYKVRSRPSLVAVEVPGGGRIKDKRAPKPADIVTVIGTGGRRVLLHRLAADAWQAMLAKARAAGFDAPLLLPTSGYRSVEHQQKLWNEALARYKDPKIAVKYVGRPGTSSHHSGRAIDLWLGANLDSKNIPYLRTRPIYQWLLQNAEQFGFYPYHVEPWHWEYNPPATP